jgi:hypothetical protein
MTASERALLRVTRELDKLQARHDALHAEVLRLRQAAANRRNYVRGKRRAQLAARRAKSPK